MSILGLKKMERTLLPKRISGFQRIETPQGTKWSILEIVATPTQAPVRGIERQNPLQPGQKMRSDDPLRERFYLRHEN